MSYTTDFTFDLPTSCRACCSTSCCPLDTINSTLTGTFTNLIAAGVTLNLDGVRFSPANTHPWYGSFSYSGHTLRVWFYCVPGQPDPYIAPTFTFLIWCDFDVNAYYDGFLAAFGCFAGNINYNPACDFNHDGHVNVNDAAVFNAAFGSHAGDSYYNAACDFDHDGDVDTVDLTVFNAAYNTYVGDPCYNSVYDFFLDGYVNSFDIGGFYSHLESLAFGAGFGLATVNCQDFDVVMSKTMGGFNTCWGASGEFTLEVTE